MEKIDERKQNQAGLSIFADDFDAVILAAGDYPTHPIVQGILEHAPYIVCCDGAAQTLINRGYMPHAIVGDGDSLPAHIREQYPHLIHTIHEQEYNDLTKATQFAIKELGTSDLRIAYLGCTGLREDHAIGNTFLLSFYLRELHVQPKMLTDYGWFVPAKGTKTFESFPRQQVSIFRVSGSSLTSEGLKWDAYPYNELWQGTLNEALANSFTIHSDGEYIIYRTYEEKIAIV